VQRFCRHNRFIERCSICRETVPGIAQPEGAAKRERAKDAEGSKRGARASAGGARRGGAVRGRRGAGLHVSHERRAEDDGYRSPLTPGLHASQDAERLAQEIAFAEGRLLALTTAPPDLYGEMREEEDSAQAAWMCFLSAYLCPLEGGRDSDPFAGIRRALEADWRAGELPDLEGIPLGPRTSHDPARGDATLQAYLHWAARADTREPPFVGDPAWTPGRRFERLFERLTLPGLARMGRYELLLTLGRVGLCEVRAGALYFTNAPGAAHGDLATLGAKRVFGIGDPIHLEPRARELAKAASVPVEALDLALANWEAGERATLGVPSEALDAHALERARAALEL
jgi:Alpha-glutamyl/putrescinyl thymine pyrophosphorylase clade 3